jgi:DNA-binding protein WhiA
MSFAADCREELIRIRLHEKKTRLSQLAGLTLTAGGIRLGKKASIFFQTESLPVAKHIISLATGDYNLDSVIEQKEKKSRRKPLYAVNLSGIDIERFLSDTGALRYGSDGLHILSDIPDEVSVNEETKRAFLRGSYLGGGTCVDPRRRYHLELIQHTQSVATGILALINGHGLHARITERKNQFVIYLKEGDDVMGFLALIGADSAALSFENVRTEKDMRNYINRTNNCESANIDKQVVASLKQQAAIRMILDRIPLERLPRSLRDTIELRLNNPEASLTQLAELAGIQRSGMNHRLSRLLELAAKLEEDA